ncbi:MAG: phage tail tube protein [Planctomycetota bacterium]
MRTRKKVMLVAEEAQQGVDAIALVPEADRGSLAVLVYDDLSTGTDRNAIDRRPASGSLSRERTPVGFGERPMNFGLDFRGGGSGDANRIPEFDPFVRACGLKRVPMKRLALIPTAENAGTRFQRGEQIHGAVGFDPAGWGTGISDGAPTGLGTGAAPLIGDSVTILRPNQSESDGVVGTVRGLNPGANEITVQLIQVGSQRPVQRPQIGDLILHRNISGALLGVSVLTTQMPVGFVLDYQFSNAGAMGTQTEILHCFVAQGAFSSSKPLVGSVTNVVTFPVLVDDHGYAWHPTSEQLVQFTLENWIDGAGGGVATPNLREGHTLQVRNPTTLGSVDAAASILRFDSATGVCEARVDFGRIEAGQTIAFGAVSATVAADPSPFQSETPSLSMQKIVDRFGRKALGARGSFTIEGQAGEPLKITFQFQGIAGPSGRAVLPVGLQYPVHLPPNWSAGAGELNGRPLRMSNVSLQMNNQISRGEDANADEGTAEYRVTDRDVTAQTTFDRPTFGALAVENLEEDAEWMVSGMAAGNEVGNRIGFAIVRGQLMSPSDNDNEGTVQVQVDLKARGIQGDDEVFLFSR